MTPIPRTRAPDSTLALLREGYAFIGIRCRRLDSDAFRTRLLLNDVICFSGREAAETFYGGDTFSRHEAMPVTVLKLLQDRGSVQQLEDDAHHRRKDLFLDLTGPAATARLRETVTEIWRDRLCRWMRADRIVLFDEVRAILTEAACAWVGVPVAGRDLARRTSELSAMVEGAGTAGPRAWRALVLRRRAERWLERRVGEIRDGRRGIPDGTPLHAVLRHRDADGRPLDGETAAVELLNLLRPTVAVAHYIVFAALALYEHPGWRRTFAAGDESDLDGFVHEVRRLAPFFPFVGGRARRPWTWRGAELPAGQWVLLDLYGTCRDPAAWTEPLQFRPERFRHRAADGYDFVPQGGGDVRRGHRCPGEGIAGELMKVAVRLLARSVRYEVPRQDLSVDLARIPARPRSGLVLSDVRAGR